MPSNVRPKASGSARGAPASAPMSERQQMALLLQMTSGEGSRSPGSNAKTKDRNERGETPLHLAAIKGDVEQVARLLAHKADPNVADFAGWTPLHEACNHGWYDVAVKLVQSGANINVKGLDNDTPLHDAVVNSHFKLIKLLVEKGADIHAKNSKGKSPLDLATPTVQPHLLNPSLPIPETGSSSTSRVPLRSRDDKKVAVADKKGEAMDCKGSVEDVYDFKPVKEAEPAAEAEPSVMSETPEPAAPISTSEESSKRTHSECDGNEESEKDDETKKKKRKEDTVKDTKPAPRKQGSKPSASAKNVKTTTDKNSDSPKPASTSDAEEADKTDLKVPPLKIVIPQTSEPEPGTTRNKSVSTRGALPYVVPIETGAEATQEETAMEPEAAPVVPPAPPAPAPPPVELHPRKRKMKQREAAKEEKKEDNAEEGESLHPHDQPITNCYKLFMNIRSQIENRRKGLFMVQPKPPQGFKDYMMNRCTYVLANTAPNTPTINYPPTLAAPMRDTFGEQEKERYRLRMQHVIEKEKLVLSVEQEILRVHGRAARALANQSLPFSVCTVLRDEEVYNLITPEQEEKDRNTRSRYNGRLFVSWLQDVDDKWEKIKEHMLLRHHHEAESLHAVQKMNWEWKLKELNLCDRKATPLIEEVHVPEVHVSDDFYLLPA